MTAANPFPIPPLLRSMAASMEEIRQMLLRYEAAMVEAPVTPERLRAVQDFDLAVQILQDLEHLTTHLAVELPADLMAHQTLPLAGLRLERSRQHFVSAISDRKSPASTDGATGFDLFTSFAPRAESSGVPDDAPEDPSPPDSATIAASGPRP